MTILFEVKGFTRKIYKVTSSQDDEFWGSFEGNILNKIALIERGATTAFSKQTSQS